MLQHAPLAEPLRHDEAAGEYVARYDWESDVSLSTVVVELVADVTDGDAEYLDPLGQVVNPEALDTVFDSTGHFPGAHDAATRLGFVYEGRHVEIEADGEIHIEA